MPLPGDGSGEPGATRAGRDQGRAGDVPRYLVHGADGRCRGELSRPPYSSAAVASTRRQAGPSRAVWLMVSSRTVSPPPGSPGPRPAPPPAGPAAPPTAGRLRQRPGPRVPQRSAPRRRHAHHVQIGRRGQLPLVPAAVPGARRLPHQDARVTQQGLGDGPAQPGHVDAAGQVDLDVDGLRLLLLEAVPRHLVHHRERDAHRCRGPAGPHGRHARSPLSPATPGSGRVGASGSLTGSAGEPAAGSGGPQLTSAANSPTSASSCAT